MFSGSRSIIIRTLLGYHRKRVRLVPAARHPTCVTNGVGPTNRNSWNCKSSMPSWAGLILGSQAVKDVIVLRCFFLENFDVAEVWGCPVLTRPGTFTRAAAADCSALAQACICRSQPNLPSWLCLGLSCGAEQWELHQNFQGKNSAKQ